jgi:3D (Asp-Asp-Asp) domain-containing protein
MRSIHNGNGTVANVMSGDSGRRSDLNEVGRRARRREQLRLAANALAFGVVAMVVAYSAMLAKQAQAESRLAALARTEPMDENEGEGPASGALGSGAVLEGVSDPLASGGEMVGNVAAPAVAPGLPDAEVRWFNGRPVRPARQVTMLVTAYSPDERSCGRWADGKTASLHSVETNGGRLVAADTAVLPLGSMVSVPGYAGGRIVPVLDRGGRIKGNRLDVLYPTHDVARRWGAQRLTVTVWEYADGLPPPDWRRIRDSR